MRSIFFLQIPNMGTMVPFMGTKDSKSCSLGEALFTKTQRQILGLLFSHPDKSFYAKEIFRFAGIGVGTVHRELEKLSSVGLLSIEHIGNQKHYRANKKSPIFEELKGIVQKTFGLADVLKDSLSDHRDIIKLAFIYGSVAKGTDHASSDIDVLIISGQLSYSEALSLFAVVESKLGRRVNPTIYKYEEIRNKLASDNNFVKRVIQQPKIFLIGTEDDLPAPR
jgi:predicted nucleotidyltransferase